MRTGLVAGVVVLGCTAVGGLYAYGLAREAADAASALASADISGVSQAAGEAGRGARATLEVAGELAAKGEVLRSEVDRFLAAVRAA